MRKYLRKTSVLYVPSIWILPKLFWANNWETWNIDSFSVRLPLFTIRFPITCSLQVWYDDFLWWNISDYGGVEHFVVKADTVWLPDIGLKNRCPFMSGVVRFIIGYIISVYMFNLNWFVMLWCCVFMMLVIKHLKKGTPRPIFWKVLILA